MKGKVTDWFLNALCAGRLVNKVPDKVLHLDDDPAIGRFAIEVLQIAGEYVSLQLTTRDNKGNIYSVHPVVFLKTKDTLNICDFERAFEINFK